MFVTEPLPALAGQAQPQLWSPVVAGHHRLHLGGLDDAAQLGPDLLETVRDLLQLDAPAAVVHQDSSEPQLLGVESCGG